MGVAFWHSCEIQESAKAQMPFVAPGLVLSRNDFRFPRDYVIDPLVQSNSCCARNDNSRSLQQEIPSFFSNTR